MEVTSFGFYTIGVGSSWASLTNIWSAAVGPWVEDPIPAGAPMTLMGTSGGDLYKDDRATTSADTMIFQTKDWIMPIAKDNPQRMTLAAGMRVVEIHIQAKGGAFYASYSVDGGVTWSSPVLFSAATSFVENVLYLNKTTQQIRLKIETAPTSLEIKWIEPWVIQRVRALSLVH
jgi:hypothetical protein